MRSCSSCQLAAVSSKGGDRLWSFHGINSGPIPNHWSSRAHANIAPSAAPKSLIACPIPFANIAASPAHHSWLPRGCARYLPRPALSYEPIASSDQVCRFSCAGAGSWQAHDGARLGRRRRLHAQVADDADQAFHQPDIGRQFAMRIVQIVFQAGTRVPRQAAAN